MLVVISNHKFKNADRVSNSHYKNIKGREVGWNEFDLILLDKLLDD